MRNPSEMEFLYKEQACACREMRARHDVVSLREVNANA